MKRKGRVYSWVLWLVIWQLISMMCGNRILLVGPLEVLAALIGKLGDVQFWQTIICSYGRILAGMISGILMGIALAGLSHHYRWIRETVAPFMTTIKAIPVASFSVILLIWWGAQNLSVCISFLIVLPQIYLHTLTGLDSVDRKLLEMARVFSMPMWNKSMYIIRPALAPFWISSFKFAVGIAWKSGVAAEVIGMPDFSIGEKIYLSKIHLQTADVFAWTAITILLSVVTEKLIMWCLNRFMQWEPICLSSSKEENPNVLLSAHNVEKSYDGIRIINDYSKVFPRGQITYFTSPSGSGKTTLLRILSGLESPDSGNIKGNENVAVMFQEDRLCEEYSAIKNVEMVNGDKEAAKKELLKILPAQALDKPCSQLSGGMRRRVALVRAVIAKADCLLLDEPFTGLDESNRQKVLHYIIESAGTKAVLIAAHDAVLTHYHDSL